MPPSSAAPASTSRTLGRPEPDMPVARFTAASESIHALSAQPLSHRMIATAPPWLAWRCSLSRSSSKGQHASTAAVGVMLGP